MITPAFTLHTTNRTLSLTSLILLQLLPCTIGSRSCRGDLSLIRDLGLLPHYYSSFYPGYLATGVAEVISLLPLCLSLLDVTCGYIHVIYLTYTIGSRSCSGNFFLSLSHTLSLLSLSHSLTLTLLLMECFYKPTFLSYIYIYIWIEKEREKEREMN